MDYPELNFLVGLGLIVVESLSLSLLVLLSKAAIPTTTWRAALVLTGLSILSFLYVGFLLIQSMTPAFILRIVLAALLIGGAAALLTAIFYRRRSTTLGYRLMAVGFILSTLASFLLAYGLFRSLVALPG